MKIDAFTHVTPLAYVEKAQELLKDTSAIGPDFQEQMYEAEARLRLMDRDEIDKQVITPINPLAERTSSDPELSAQLATALNNATLDMAQKHPDRFIPVGTVSMNNMSAAVKEAERCTGELAMAGIFIYTTVGGRLLNDPDCEAFFEYMNSQNKPIWLHPAYNSARTSVPYNLPGKNERGKQPFNPDQVFGWPLETVVAMACLIYSGMLDKYPNLRIITHHAGSMIPSLEQRILTHPGYTEHLKKPLLDYFRSFYVDSAVQGSIGGMQATYAFYGRDHILFGSDAPRASLDGSGNAAAVVRSINALAIPESEKVGILSGNVTRLIGE